LFQRRRSFCKQSYTLTLGIHVTALRKPLWSVLPLAESNSGRAGTKHASPIRFLFVFSVGSQCGRCQFLQKMK
ncbi:hypothetical protein Celaphus_00009432, partial [Cervus elaphus hippelaphus]